MFKIFNSLLLKLFFLSFILVAFPYSSNSIKLDEITAEEVIIKKRKSIFSKNYSTAKKVQTFATKGDFEKAKSLMIEMSKNYVDLISLFPDNAKKGFKTEALPSIWENKDEFNQLMKKSSDDMIKLAANIETAADVKQSLGNMMWANCKACHSKFRAPH
tara:strand:+ start:874 stop:1350 length:477 start_codon:yes stop_codon:yes gene_type:complete